MRTLWWHARFMWCAFCGLDFESQQVQSLVREHFVRSRRGN